MPPSLHQRIRRPGRSTLGAGIAGEQTRPGHADGIGRYFVEPLAARGIDELGSILARLIRASQLRPA